MSKQELLKSIAQTAYNIGFGAKKHFATYDLYRIFPRLISLTALIIGILQLTSYYKSFIGIGWQDFIAVILVVSGLIGLVIELVSHDNERIELAGKQLLLLFNRLRSLYNEVKGQPENVCLESYWSRLSQIEEEFKQTSISNLAIGTNIYTHWAFFGGSMQIDWVDEQLKFKITDKFPFLHIEAILLYIAVTIPLGHYIFPALGKLVRTFIQCS